MRLEELQLFRRAAALGGLAAAGRELGLSPAAATARLQALERSLGVTLFVRTTRRLSLTEEGELLLAHAVSALDELEAARAALGGAEANPSGLLRASVPGPFGQKHILPYLSEFMGLYPKVELDLHVSDQHVNVVEGGYEVVVRVGPLADSALRATKLAGNRRILVAAPGYLDDAPPLRDPEDLVRHNCLVTGDLRVWRFSRGGEERVAKVSGSLHLYDGGAARDAAVYGLGLALKSVFDVYEDLCEGRLVQLLPDWEVRDVGAIWALRPPSRFVAPRAKAFIEFLKGKYGATPYWEAACAAR
ncbi:MAG: LysR family transcriptional regulator [Rhodobacteraceae bacterium]|nr:LysR family transcriptional regulator [Paracoccaceae bacterium]